MMKSIRSQDSKELRNPMGQIITNDGKYTYYTRQHDSWDDVTSRIAAYRR